MEETFITLILVPTVYTILEDFRNLAIRVLGRERVERPEAGGEVAETAPAGGQQ
jgi:hypothetical protein